MSGLLGSIFSFGDDLKKRARGVPERVRGLLDDPIGYTNAALGEFNERAQQAGRGLLHGPNKGQAAVDSMDALGIGPHALGGLLGAIKVYHGSPHVFDKADSSKIGTGEGAQAYGHGLYWAENPEVAKTYRRAGMDPRDAMKTMTADEQLTGAVDAFKARGLDEDALYSAMRRQFPSTSSMDIHDAIASPRPNLYEANLRWPDAAREAKDPLGPQHFLDWDKPLSQQSVAIQGAAQQTWGDNFMEMMKRGKVPALADATGGDFYTAMGRGRDSHSAALMADDLRKAGIPGVAYMDAGSRAAGQGTRNYVTFDDALVELLSRNGLPLK